MITIRDAKPSDRDAIFRIDDITARSNARIKFIDRVLSSNLVLVAEANNRVVGYAVLEYTFFECGFISMVYVSESCRRRGVATALIEGLSGRCETEKLFTSTNESNEPMKQLLLQLGYSPSGVIHNLDPGDPELVYFKNLAV